MTTEDPDVAKLLEEIAKGEHEAAETLMPLVYDRLRLLAQKLLGHESPGHTLQPTALVNEAFVRLVAGEKPGSWENRRHFFAAAAEARWPHQRKSIASTLPVNCSLTTDHWSEAT